MKRIVQLVFILFIQSYQSNLIRAQNPSSESKCQYSINFDSLSKVADRWQDSMIKVYNLHKDNKDSAWINDFEGNYVWDSRSKSKDGKTLTIIDSLTNNYYILDSLHTTIIAYNQSKQILWMTDPRKANSIPEYRHKNPDITYFKIKQIEHNYNEIFNKGERAIYIIYSNSQFGFLDLNTGKFIFLGQR